MKTYTVELEVSILADCAQEAFEMASYALQRETHVQSVSGICTPYCDEDPIDFEENSYND